MLYLLPYIYILYTQGFIQALFLPSIFAFKIWVSLTNGYRTMAYFEEICKSTNWFYDKLTLLKTRVDPPLGMLEHWIEVTLKTELQNVWKWSPAHYCVIKIFWKILASSIFSKNIICFVFLKSPVRIRAPHCLKRAVHLKARNSCIKLYTWIDYLFIIISNFLEKVKKYRSRLLKEEDQTINEINAVLKIE